MSLNWSFKEKVGEAVIRQGDKNFKLNLYQGNAFLIFLSEWEEDGKEKYQLYLFFADKVHAKNCLGLVKGYDSIFDDGNKIVKIRLNKKKYSYTKDLVDMLIKAFDEIQIEIYSEVDDEI